MRGEEKNVNNIFNDSQSLFIIPLYQRKYTWSTSNCDKLFDDIVATIKENRPSHFFGSIVLCHKRLSDPDYLIIDGQQRLTTISILIMALTDAAKNGEIECQYPEDIKNVRDEYLYANRRRGERNIKIRPIHEDMVAYDALLSGDSESYVANTKATANYRNFYNRIVSSGLTFEQIINGIERLVIVSITLDSEDDPQLIFESLNSTGVDLSEADKVRNYLLMSLNNKDQDEYYTKYWSKIEKCAGDDPTMFIRDYLTVYLHCICNIDVLYNEFKKYDKSKHIDREVLLQDMLKYARYYEQIANGTTGIQKVDKRLKQLMEINSFVHMPFLMSFFDYAKTENLCDDEKYNVLNIVESYWARRIICSYPSNALAKVFATLHYEIKKIIDLHDKRNEPLNVPYSEILKFVLLRKQGNAVFPRNESTETGFRERLVYKIPIDHRNFLFERMENEDGPEGNRDIVGEMHHNERPISIEHIMPQTLTDEWIEALGERHEEIYERYLHTFANLTLTGYNQNYSNRPFFEKKNGYYDKKGEWVSGFNDSGYRLSAYLKNVNQWTEKEILERQSILLDKFMALFPMITTNYAPSPKEAETVSLDEDDFEFTNRKIIAFSYKDMSSRILVESWKDMLVKVSKLVYQEKPAQMSELASKCYWYHNSPTPDRTKVADNVFVYSECDNKSKKSILKYLFDNLNIPLTELELHIEPISPKVIEEE